MVTQGHALDQLLYCPNSSSTNSKKTSNPCLAYCLSAIPDLVSRRKYDAFHDELVLQPITLKKRTPILGTSPGHHALYQHCRCNVPQVPAKIEYSLQNEVLKDTNISILVLDCSVTSIVALNHFAAIYNTTPARRACCSQRPAGKFGTGTASQNFSKIPNHPQVSKFPPSTFIASTKLLAKADMQGTA